MKRIQKTALLAALVPALVLSSCSNEFLNRTPTTALDTNIVLDDPDMLPTTVVGSMSMFSGMGFMGRNAIIGGEMMTDVAVTMGKSGHLEDFEKWNIFPNDDDLSGYWSYCYSIAAAAAQTTYHSKKILKERKDRKLTEDQVKALQNAIAVSNVIKAYCDYFLIQNFCVDINLDEADVPGKRKNTKVGIVLIQDQPLSIRKDDLANMCRLEDAYAWIEKELDEAVQYFDSCKNNDYIAASEKRYFPTKCAAQVMRARVFLAQHKHEKAIEAVDEALKILPAGTTTVLFDKREDLEASYESTSATKEDIWTINYTSQDNLSANSLCNFFGSYNCKISDAITSKFQSTDYRSKLYPTTPGKRSCCLKYPNQDNVFNVPVMRVPELYLIKAECYAALGNNAKMVENLTVVLKARDTRVDGEDDVANGNYKYGSLSTKEQMIGAVLDERVKELCAEGFRWSDLRRNAKFGARLDRPGPKQKGTDQEAKRYMLHFGDYNLARYALPVPYMETSSEQWANGKGILVFDENGKHKFDVENWQNNAWDSKSGDTYTLSDPNLQPKEGEGLNADGTAKKRD